MKDTKSLGDNTDPMMNGVDKDALDATIEAIRENPELAQVTFTLETEWLGGCHQRSSTGDLRQNGRIVESRRSTYVLESDEPAALLGTDTAASPGEYILQALAGCYAVTYATNATARGIELTSLKLGLEADFDLQGFLNLDDSVRPGAQEVKVTVQAKAANATRQQLEELTKAVQERSPIGDTLRNAVRVTTVLAE